VSLLAVQYCAGYMGKDSGYGLSDLIPWSDNVREHHILDCRAGHNGSVVLYLKFGANVRD